MMKNRVVFLTLFLGFLGLLVSSSNIYAYPFTPNPVTVNQEIYFGNGPGTTNGGAFHVYDWYSHDYLFDSFCLERDEYLNFGSQFVVDDISDEARDGGVAGSVLPREPPGPGPPEAGSP